MNPEDKKTSVSHSDARGRAHNLKHYSLPQLLMHNVHHYQPFTMFHSVTELAFSAHCSVQQRETRMIDRQRETETERGEREERQRDEREREREETERRERERRQRDRVTDRDRQTDRLG